MADDTTISQADHEAALAKLNESIEKLEAKNAEIVADLRKANAKARAASEITPEAHQAEIDAHEQTKAALAETTKQLKSVTGERDKAVKAFETESIAARNAMLERDISEAVAAGGILPAAVPQYTAWLKAQDAKVEVVDGKMVTTISGKPPKDFVTEHVGTDEGKTFKAAALNGGGGAPGGNGGGGAPKTMPDSQFRNLPQAERMRVSLEGVKPVPDQA
jgi:hypothetical protein